MTTRTSLTDSPAQARRNGIIVCIIAAIAIGVTIPTAYEPFTRSNSWEVFANLLSGVVPTVAWLVGLYFVLKNRVELGIQIGLIASIIAIPLTTLWIEGIAIANAVVVGVGVTIISGICLRPALARWLVIAGAVAAGMCLVLDYIAPTPRLIAGQDAEFLNVVSFVGVGALIVFLFFQFPRYSLRTKLIIVFVGLALLSTIGITFVATRAIRETLTANVARDMRTRAQAAALSVGLTMDRNVDRVQTLSFDTRIQDELTLISDSYPMDAQELDEALARNANVWASADPSNSLIRNALNGTLAASLQQFGRVYQGNKELLMTDATGSTVATTGWSPTYNYRDENWWQIAYNEGRGGIYIGQPEFNPMINDYGVRIAMPIYSAAGKRVVGVVQSTFTFTALQRALLLNSFGESGKVDLLFPKGQILTSDGTFRALTPNEFEEIKMGISEPLARLNYRGTSLLSGQGVVGVSDEQPEPYLRSSVWRTITTVQEQEALGAIEAGVQAALLAGIGTIIAAIAVALLLAQFLTRPIRRLTVAAEQVQAGDLTARAPVETGDEIGTLARTFNSMTARLQDTLSGLEQRVAVRTQELSQANLTLQSNSAYLSALSDTSTGLFARLKVNELLQAIVERAGALLGTENGFVFFAEPGDDEIEMRVGSGLYDDLVGTRAQPGVGLAGSVWQSGQTRVIDDYQKWEGRLPGSRRDALHSIVAVPLKRGAGNADDATLGVIGLAYTDEERKFGRTEVEILERFAQLALIALDNAQLYADSENRVQELGALNSISQIVAEESDLDALIEKVGNQVSHIFDTDFAYIALSDAAQGKVEFAYVLDDGKRIELEPLKPGEGLTAQVIATRQPVRLANANETDYARLGAVDSGDGTSPTALMSVPLISGENAIGVISVQRTGQARNFTPEDQRLLTTVAQTVAVGIESARLSEATNRQVAELAALNRISAILTSEKPLGERLAEVGRELHGIFGVSSVYVAMYDAVSNWVRMPFFMGDDQEFGIEPFELGPGFTSHVIETRAPLLINDDMKARMSELQALSAGDGEMNESYLGVPILLGDQVLGVIGLADEPKNKFVASDVNLLSTISAAIASAIQNARLLEQTQERARELDAVNSLAREITQQRSLDDLFQEVYLQVKSVASAEGLIVSLYDERTDTLTVPFLMDEGKRYEITPDALQMERDYSEQVRRGEALMINSTPEEVAELERSPAVAGAGRASRSRLYVPLMAGVRFLGMISLHSYDYNAYSERDVGVMSGLASHIAIALENARLFEQTDEALSETERLYEMAQAANAETDDKKFYQRVHEIVAQAMPATNFYVALANDTDNTLEFAHFVDERDELPETSEVRSNLGKGSTAYVLRTRQPLLATPEDFRRLEARGELEPQGFEPESWLGVPLMRGDKAIGVVTVQSYDPAVLYTERDKQVLQNLSQGIANAIERKRAEAALKLTQSQLVEAMRITHLGNWEYDFVNDVFTFTDAFYELMRTSAEREGGYRMSSATYSERFVYPEDLALVGQEIGAAVVTTDPNFSRELDHRVYFGDGELGYVTVRFRIEKDGAGRTVKSYGANLDITERKRAEVELERVAEQARESAEQVSALNRRLTREGWGAYLDPLGALLVAEAAREEFGLDNAPPIDANGGSNYGNGENGHNKVRVPIHLRGEVIGEIELEAEEAADAMSAEDMGLVTQVAENIGLALDNARLFGETQRRVTELDALNQISQAASTELDVNSLLDVIGSQLREMFQVQNAYIALYDRESETITLPYFVEDNQRLTVEPLTFGEGITSAIIRTREPLVLNRNAAVEMEKLGARVVGNPARSYLGVPILVGDEVTGVISVQSTTREDLFDEGNVRLLETIAATVGASIQNAQLYGAMQQEVVERQRAEEEIKLSLREKEVLLKEIHHRVKNNLQIITSLLNLQSAQIKDPEALVIFRESQARVRSMALIHEKLYQSKDLARIDFDGYFRDLMVYLYRSYAANPEHVRPHLNANSMFLAIDTAIPCGLIISELVTNTIKYAFPDGKRGNLFISIGPEDDGHLTLLVKDDGVGFPEGFDWRESDSLGLQLVSTLASQLHGTIHVDGTKGTTFKITFPG